MSVPYPIPVTAAQVGTYFVTQYYQMLEQRPELIHQFFSNSSTMLRIDGSVRDSASSMLQIHTLIMSLNYTGFEIRTANALESWNRGVLVMVSGVAQLKNFNARRKFVETFFLAPQEKGFFVLNDVFQVIDEEPIHHHPTVFLAEHNLDSTVNTPAAPEPVPNYLLGGEIEAMDFVSPPDAKESGGPVDNYSFQEQPSQQVADAESIIGENAMDENSVLQNATNTAQDHLPAPIEEPAGEPQKHTYASIVARGQSVPSAVPQPSVNKSTPLAPGSEWNHPPQSTSQQAYMISNSFERLDIAEEVPPAEDEDEIRSVYVRNLPSTVSEAEIEEEFKSFGSIAPDGVVIRSRKDVGVCYAFVEFEDMAGVHNAVKAGSAHVAGRQVYIEERRPNSNIPFRAARGRGRGRGSYQTDAPRGRFGSRSFGRGGGYDGVDRDYNRARGNGYYRPSPRQASRNGQDQSE